MSSNPPSMLPGLEQGSTHEELTKDLFMASLIVPSKIIEGAGVMQQIVATFTDWLSSPYAWVIRLEPGERTLSPLKVVNTFIALKAYWFVASGLWYLSGQVASITDPYVIKHPLMDVPPIIQAVVLISGLYQLWASSYRRRKGVRILSTSAGWSVLEAVGLLDGVNALLKLAGIPFLISRWTLYLYAEPLLVAMAAYATGPYDTLTSVWLWIVCGSWYVQNAMMEARQRHKLLSYWDSQINSENLVKAALGAPPTETQGVQVIPGYKEAIAHAAELDIKGRVDKTFSSE